MINQYEFIRRYNDENREQFNDELFDRNDDDIIREIENVILSCQRKRTFTLKVINFSVVDDYDEINRLLREYEKNNLNRSKATDNKYDYIQLKPTAIRLLIVDYYLEVYNTTEIGKRKKVLRVYIEIPKIVDKYYFQIGGNLDISMSQVIESTYNNSNTNSLMGMVAYKTMFMASRVFRFEINNGKEKRTMTTVSGEVMKGVFFSSIIFNKPVPAVKYLLARFGLYETLRRYKCDYIKVWGQLPELDEEKYYIIKSHNIYISIPRYIYDNDTVTQSLVYTLFMDSDSETDVNNIFSCEYWLSKLGKAFGTKTDSINKGYSVLESLESICDIASMKHLRLQEDHKKDIYDILVWVLREFSELRMKDNLNIGMKRIRWAEYFACIYAYKLIKGIYYHISDRGNKVTLHSIEKSVNISPDYLIRQIARDKLTNPYNMANDNDAIAALKYTYKGISGLGEDDTAIPLEYRQVNKSHIGRVDLDSSSNSDPGMTGTICPISDIHDGWFSDEQEPDEWREKIEELHSKYREMEGLKQTLLFKKELGMSSGDDDSRIDSLEETLDSTVRLLNPFSSLDKHLYGNKLFSEVLW